MDRNRGCATPMPALRRLPAYLRLLQAERREGRLTISGAEIAEALDLDQSQVRKDLALTGAVGRPRVGYDLDVVIEAVEECLGWRRDTLALLVGAGNLGSALLGYPGFGDVGLRIVGVFDADPATIGRRIRHHQVLDVRDLARHAAVLQPAIGLLAVPGEQAQVVAAMLVQAGMRGIWNFTPTRLVLPPEVVVEDVDLSASLAVLSHRLAVRPAETMT